MSAEPTSQITRSDIEKKFRELQGGATQKAEAAGATALKVAVAVVAAVVLVSFLVGRRKGRRQTTIVEIRRV